MKSALCNQIVYRFIVILGGFDKFERVYVKNENKKKPPRERRFLPICGILKKTQLLTSHKKNIINVNTWLEPTQNHRAGVDDLTYKMLKDSLGTVT